MEDEWLIAMEVETALSDAGHRTVGPARDVVEALKLIEEQEPEVALLDANLVGASSKPIAEMLAARSVPFAVVSGYGGLALDAPLSQAVRRIDKPFSDRQIVDAVAELDAARTRN